MGNLRHTLKSVDREGLQACKDYVLFPLFILLDAAIACRGKRSFYSTSYKPMPYLMYSQNPDSSYHTFEVLEEWHQ